MDEIITIAFGNGGKKTSKIIEEIILPSLNNSMLKDLGDGALISTENQLAFSTDSFVIDPIFFPGGDIGKLSICGTVNDLLMCGSIPKFLSLSFIIEEGLEMKVLKNIVNSISETAKRAGVLIVTGDTKVVDKGHGHGIYINTSGIGERIPGIDMSTSKIQKGDKIIISGNIADHGMAVFCAREKFLPQNIVSDCAPLNAVVEKIMSYKEKVKIMRDPTRGGVATTLNEFVEQMDYSIELFEDKIPVSESVTTVCELLGMDPLYIANEGKVLTIVSEDISEALVKDLRKIEISKDANIIGEVVDYAKSKLILRTSLGGKRLLEKLSQDILPRIC